MTRHVLACAFAITPALLTGCYIKSGGSDPEDLGYEFAGGGAGAADGCGGGDAGNAGGSAGGSGGSAGGSDGGGAPSLPCVDHDDCEDGFICDLDLCVPGELTCGEIETESACLERPDCEPVYAGVDCTCGPDCTCIGGEPGCVCASFEFFMCEAL